MRSILLLALMALASPLAFAQVAVVGTFNGQAISSACSAATAIGYRLDVNTFTFACTEPARGNVVYTCTPNALAGETSVRLRYNFNQSAAPTNSVQVDCVNGVAQGLVVQILDLDGSQPARCDFASDVAFSAQTHQFTYVCAPPTLAAPACYPVTPVTYDGAARRVTVQACSSVNPFLFTDQFEFD
jgi:hypothetical protein